MEDLSKRDIQSLQKEIEETVKVLDLEKLKKEIYSLEQKSLETDFWSNSEKAKIVMDRISYLKDEVETAERLSRDIASLVELFNSIKKETEQNELIEEYEKLKKELDSFSLRKFLSGEYDKYPTILSISSGQGGTESNDWTEMLYRMYTMYFDKMGWKYEITEMLKGNETGISTVTIHINQPLAFGMLKKEHGSHRLVRISPFNAQGLRQTTFAGVEVLPILPKDEKTLDIPEKDILFKAVKSGGPGGQNVNKTSSAVQITHIPTNITVSSSSQRSQAQNRESAMNLLRGKLWRIKKEEKLEKISDIKGEYKIAGWGNQIRNYILHPYKLVKDLRTGVELNDPEYVLDGNIEKLVEAQIRMK